MVRMLLGFPPKPKNSIGNGSLSLATLVQCMPVAGEESTDEDKLKQVHTTHSHERFCYG